MKNRKMKNGKAGNTPSPKHSGGAGYTDLTPKHTPVPTIPAYGVSSSSSYTSYNSMISPHAKSGEIMLTSQNQSTRKHPRITVKVKHDDWERLKAYILMCEKEISIFGITKQVRIKDKYMVNHEIHIERLLPLPTQTNTGTSTEVEISDLEPMRNSLTEDERKRMCLWVHSHVNMGAFWSSTDDTNIDEWAFTPYLLSIVLNKKMEFKIRYDMLTPFKHTCEDVDLVVVGTPAIYSEVAAEIERTCKAYTYTPPTTPTTSHMHDWRTRHDWDDEDFYGSGHGLYRDNYGHTYSRGWSGDSSQSEASKEACNTPITPEKVVQDFHKDTTRPDEAPVPRETSSHEEEDMDMTEQFLEILRKDYPYEKKVWENSQSRHERFIEGYTAHPDDTKVPVMPFPAYPDVVEFCIQAGLDLTSLAITEDYFSWCDKAHPIHTNYVLLKETERAEEIYNDELFDFLLQFCEDQAENPGNLVNAFQKEILAYIGACLVDVHSHQRYFTPMEYIVLSILLDCDLQTYIKCNFPDEYNELKDYHASYVRRNVITTGKFSEQHFGRAELYTTV